MFTATDAKLDEQHDEQLLFAIPQVCRILSMSRSSVYRELGKNALRSMTIGGKRRVSKQALLEFVAAHERATEQSAQSAQSAQSEQGEQEDA